MKRLTTKRKDGRWALVVHKGSRPLDNIPMAVDKLAAYEDAEEKGLLIRLPCKVGSHVWRIWKTDGRKPEIIEHYMSDLLHVVQWMDKFGKTVFLTREEAESAKEAQQE